jgi:hypothetical protein
MGDDNDLPPAVAAKRTIRYFDDDIEAAPEHPHRDLPWANLPRLKRQGSTGSIRSERSMGRAVDPALELPTIYRTISFNITTTQERNAEASKEAKQKAGDGNEHHQILKPAD